jgi:hypothetical protein
MGGAESMIHVRGKKCAQSLRGQFGNRHHGRHHAPCVPILGAAADCNDAMKASLRFAG